MINQHRLFFRNALKCYNYVLTVNSVCLWAVSATSVDIKRVTKNRVNNLARGISRTFPARLFQLALFFSILHFVDIKFEVSYMTSCDDNNCNI